MVILFQWIFEDVVLKFRGGGVPLRGVAMVPGPTGLCETLGFVVFEV